ncbi:unnamed protein product [Cochlearia groenlandica]
MRRGKKKEEDEVEEMLKAAQDEMILKLSVDSHHRSRSGIDYLDPDLHSRFLSLKSQTSATKKDQIRRTRSPPQKSKDVVVEEEESTEDLMARFSSLKKTSLPSSSVSPSVNLRDGIGEDDEDDEVEKLIQWAIDAARLDPSPPSDDDDDDQSCDDDDGDNDSTKDNKS